MNLSPSYNSFFQNKFREELDRKYGKLWGGRVIGATTQNASNEIELQIHNGTSREVHSENGALSNQIRRNQSFDQTRSSATRSLAASQKRLQYRKYHSVVVHSNKRDGRQTKLIHGNQQLDAKGLNHIIDNQEPINGEPSIGECGEIL